MKVWFSGRKTAFALKVDGLGKFPSSARKKKVCRPKPVPPPVLTMSLKMRNTSLVAPPGSMSTTSPENAENGRTNGWVNSKMLQSVLPMQEEIGVALAGKQKTTLASTKSAKTAKHGRMRRLLCFRVT